MLKLVEETEGAAKAALHKVEVVAGLVFRDVHRVVGEVIEATELELGNLLESGRARRAPVDAVVGVPTGPGQTPAQPVALPAATAEPAATVPAADTQPSATPPVAQ